MSRTAIEVSGLTRHYKTKHRSGMETSGGFTPALCGVNLEVEYGEVRGLLGPNGAGKTTLVRILSTVLLPTDGQAKVLGWDITTQASRIRPEIGIVFGGERGLYGSLTVRENLAYWATLYGASTRRRERQKAVDELINRLGLEDRRDTQVDRLSRGMKQRLHLARGLVGNPRVLFLDEPTVGMDPVAAHEFRGLVNDLKMEGVTILLTTHDMREAEAICDLVTLIDRGKVIGTEAPSRVGKWLTSFVRVDALNVPESIRSRLATLNGIAKICDLADGWTRIATNEATAVQPILRALLEANVTNVRTSLPSLEDVYLEIIGKRGLAV